MTRRPPSLTIRRLSKECNFFHVLHPSLKLASLRYVSGIHMLRILGPDICSDTSSSQMWIYSDERPFKIFWYCLPSRRGDPNVAERTRWLSSFFFSSPTQRTQCGPFSNFDQILLGIKDSCKKDWCHCQGLRSPVESFGLSRPLTPAGRTSGCCFCCCCNPNICCCPILHLLHLPLADSGWCSDRTVIVGVSGERRCH